VALCTSEPPVRLCTDQRAVIHSELTKRTATTFVGGSVTGVNRVSGGAGIPRSKRDGTRAETRFGL